MFESRGLTALTGPNGPVMVVFGEATPSQRLQCYKLAAAAFGSPLSEADYLRRETYLGQRPLTRNNGWRFWCLSVPGDDIVLATCKTMHRELLVRDAGGSRQQQAYCIASVVTDSWYRRYGLASLLLKHVAEWMDGPGEAAASMLYTSIGDFYVSRGWKMLPAFDSTLWLPSTGHITRTDRANLPSTRPLTSNDITSLCERDVEDIKAKFSKYSVSSPDIIHVAVLPTTNIISWLHDRGDFISLKTHDRVSQTRGAICSEPAADSWLYWHHDFRKDQLAVQRVVCLPTTNKSSHDATRALASLILDALEESKRWSLPKVVVWDPSEDLLRAMQLLAQNFGIQVENTERTMKSIPSLRWNGSDDTKEITVHMNEFYAWS